MSAPQNTPGSGSANVRLTGAASALLETLQSIGQLSDDQRAVVEIEHRISGEPVESLLRDYGFVSRECLQQQSTGIDYLDLDAAEFVPDSAAVGLLDETSARRHQALPLAFESSSGELTLALACVDDLMQRDRLLRVVQHSAPKGRQPVSVRFVQAGAVEIAQAIDRCYGFRLDLDAILREHDGLRGADATQTDAQQPVVRLIDAILDDAVASRASDIHLAPEQGFVRVRYRIDGVLQPIRCLHHHIHPAMVVRIKVLCDLDITETRLPQDGQFTRRLQGERVNFRVSTFPVRTGENIVLRVLDRRQANRTLAELDLPDTQNAQLQQVLRRPQGLIVVAGPIGSGKSTTLYALLGERDDDSLNIMTLEDPVEYPMPRVRQASVNASRGLDFAAGVRALLRQDPDILLIGEIRDADSCVMAFRAAMSGHQVLTTVHANDAVGALYRLRELGVGLALQATTVSAVVSQRLVRRCCRHCIGVGAEVGDTGDGDGNDVPGVVDTPAGDACRFCHGSGYHGRQVCMEILELTPALAEHLLDDPSPEALRRHVRSDGLITLADAVGTLVRDSITDQPEAARVLGIDTPTAGDGATCINTSSTDRESEDEAVHLAVSGD